MLGTESEDFGADKGATQHLFEEDKLPFGNARELAGRWVWDFLHLLGNRGLLVHYDVEAYAIDRETLGPLGRM